jgi:hypothetical protein
VPTPQRRSRVLAALEAVGFEDGELDRIAWGNGGGVPAAAAGT